jgi:23S rRNA maturation mini-RNase III
MAVISTKTQSAFVMKIKEGVDTNGKDILKSQRFSKIKVDAADDQIFDVSDVLRTLLKYTVLEVVREDDNTLIRE